ncbi:ABC transporter permease [Glaciihabitans sp. dw_435]|uniref:ABC transporter permease n=1 Tax=Glaciihabitans sp. dw_435 TaxID=2720081 RepID=UPI001BD237F6|nr:ABC transporter permease [Glaciihabitans sp. dw_435]
MTIAAITVLLVITVQMAAPLLWVTLGEIISERSGVLNIGAEGTMLLGAWATATAISFGASPLVACLAGIGVGAIVGLVMSVLYIWRRVDQIVGGIMVNLFALGFTTAMWAVLQGTAVGVNAPTLTVPLLSDIPFIGTALFSQNATVYLAILAAPAVFALIRRTRWGLRLRAAGEQPSALDSAGVSVRRVRTSGLITGTCLAGLGGACLVVTSASGGFVANMTAGTGFIALGVVILARWNPLVALLTTVVFGLLKALQFQAQSFGPLSDVPNDVWLAVPYIVAIVAVAAARSTRFAPTVGVPWSRH